MERLEDTILRNLLYNEEYARKTLPFFKDEYFTQFSDRVVFQEIKKYFKIINSKTAALFAAATRVGACITNKNRKEKDALESYGRNLGLAFQIADDALDYYSTKTIFGKEIGKDFFEGKVTLPIIFLCQKANAEEKIFLKIFFTYVDPKFSQESKNHT